jgi:hypothetical protein
MSVSEAFDVSRYTGLDADCGDQRQAAVLLENSTISRNVYRPGTVDYVFFDQAVVLNEKTAEYLYSEFTPLEQPYQPGSRVFLEKAVKAATAGCKSDADRAIALNDWVRDVPVMYGRDAGPFGGATGDVFHGGAEEEVIRKGSSMCNEQSRVLAIMAQIAGLPSRYVGHMTLIDYDDPNSGTGHGVNEIYVDGSWAYFDIRGRYFLKDDGSFASTWDLLQDPELVNRQNEEVLSHRWSRGRHDTFGRFYLPPSVTIVVNYLAADHASYDYSWTYPSSVRALESREAGRRIRVQRHGDLLPQPRPRAI